MPAYLKLFLLFVAAFCMAWLAHQAIVPNVVPVADGDGQANWQVQAAFVLLAIENIGLGGAALVVVAAVLNRLQRLRAR
jgi:hypothetical protein